MQNVTLHQALKLFPVIFSNQIEKKSLLYKIVISLLKFIIEPRHVISNKVEFGQV